MTAVALVRHARGALERLFDALIDPARCERTMAILLAAYAAVWTLYGVIAKGSQDIHFDMGEIVSWSHEVVLGTSKHPPLAAWLVRLWFDVMPAQTWAYYLFAVVMATVALWIAWRVAGHYLSAEKRVIAIVLLTFVPFYNFHALKFNANTVLIPFWAATTWWFLRSLETRRAGWAILTGVGAAAAVLGKYWSFFLLAALGLAALCDPRRAVYFRSAAPWLTVAVTAALIAPHVIWVITHNFEPLRYAFGAHHTTHLMAALYTLNFVAGIIGYIAAPIVLTVIAARPSLAAIYDTVWPTGMERRTCAIVFVGPNLIATAIAILLEVRMNAIWTMSGMTLLPVVLLSSPLVKIDRQAAVRLLGLAIVFPVVMAMAAPIIAIAIHRQGVPAYATHYQLIARAVEQAWGERTNAPLRIIGSSYDLANGIVFYFAGQPSTYAITAPQATPWVDEDRIKREGIAMVCPVPEQSCVDAMNRFAARYPDDKPSEVTLARRYFGALDNAVQYRILVIPPQPG
jgi:hypothetical protein